MKEKIKKIASHPITKQALLSIKPEKNIWGNLGVLLFFIAPEIIAYIWSDTIVNFAQEALKLHPLGIEKFGYDVLIKLFENGVSWLNLGFGILLLVWLCF